MDNLDVEIIYMSWDRIKVIPNYKEEFGVRLFQNVKKLNPTMGAIFQTAGGQPDRMHAALFSSMIDLIVHMLGPDLQPLIGELKDLGERHATYGVKSKHYPVLGNALMSTLSEFLGDQFHAEAWMNLYRLMSLSMCRGARIDRQRKRASKLMDQSFHDDDHTESSSSSSTLYADEVVVMERPRSLLTPTTARGSTKSKRKKGALDALRNFSFIRQLPKRTKPAPKTSRKTTRAL